MAVVSQGRPDPRLICPEGSSSVELPGAQGGRVLRCVDDTTGKPHGPEVWLGSNGYYWQRGRWEKGVRHGQWERWYPTGHLMARFTINQGVVASARCLSEQKRKDIPCDDHQPMDWVAPGSAPPPSSAAAPPPAAPAQPADPGTPMIAPMPPLPPDPSE
jgi:hypothetical protein